MQDFQDLYQKVNEMKGLEARTRVPKKKIHVLKKEIHVPKKKKGTYLKNKGQVSLCP
jgi:hypothetical protein